MNSANSSPSLGPESLQHTELVSFCKAAGDPLRLDILKVLSSNAYGVLELCRLFDVKQSGMSHHLKVLAGAGLVSTRREGNSIFYRRTLSSDNPVLHDLHQALLTTVDAAPIQPPLAERLAKLAQERSEASLTFFEQNIQRFKANQDLIAGYEQYGSSIVELLDSVLDDENKGTALEVGPGEGLLLKDLSPRFQQVVALDNSEQVLALAKQYTKTQALENIEFVLGDVLDTSLTLPPFDCITLNMVLHHIPTPALAFSNLSRLLRDNGLLLVTDLCRHDQIWARENCGDIWLGFDTNDLTNWAASAGLAEGSSLFLALRNGFQIQLRHFIKRT